MLINIVISIIISDNTKKREIELKFFLSRANKTLDKIGDTRKEE